MKYFMPIILCSILFGCNRAAVDYETVVDYEIVETKFIGTRSNNRMMYKIVVDPTITGEQVRPTARKIINIITSKDKNIDEITLYFYSDRDFLDQAFNIAMVDWGYPENKGRINIKIIENFEQDIKQYSKSETLFGLTEQARREIFREIVIAEDKGWSAFPLPNAAIEREKLQEKYKQKIRRKYNITKEIEEKITNEGDREKWPLPF